MLANGGSLRHITTLNFKIEAIPAKCYCALVSTSSEEDWSNGSHWSDMPFNALARQYLRLSTRLKWWCFECHSTSDDIFRVPLASDDRHKGDRHMVLQVNSLSAFCSVLFSSTGRLFHFHLFMPSFHFSFFPSRNFLCDNLNNRSWILNLEFPILRTRVCLRMLKDKLHVRSVYLRKCTVSHRTENLHPSHTEKKILKSSNP